MIYLTISAFKLDTGTDPSTKRLQQTPRMDKQLEIALNESRQILMLQRARLKHQRA